MKYLLILILITNLASQAKLGANFEDNAKQYGEPVLLESFPSRSGYTGYATYNIDSKFKLKAFYINNKSRSEHLIQQNGVNFKMSRDQVKDWAGKMFAMNLRGGYKTQLTFPKAEGHFFDKGLVSYEYYVEKKNTKGYKSVKVLFYEDDANFKSINPRAYL